MATAFRADPSRLSPIDDAAPAPKAAFKPDPSRLEPEDPSAEAFERGLNRPPRYFTNPADQAIAETPVVRQVFRGAANTLDAVKSMALRGKAVFNSAIDDRGGAYDALKQADAIDAEKARREAEFQKTSGTAGNVGAGVVESLTFAAPAAMMGGAPAAIGAASASQGNQAYYEGKKAGLTGTDLAQHVAMQTLLEGAPAAMSQIAGVGGLEKRLAALGEPVQRGVKAALARFGKASLEELPEELATTLTQQIAGAKAGTGTATPQDLADGAFQTTLQTLATAGLVESPSIARGAVDAMRKPPAPPSSDAPANAAPTGDMNLTLTPEQPVTQSDVADIFAMFDEPAAQPAAGAPIAPVARQTPDTLPPLPPGATIPVQGTTAPRAQQPDSMKATLGDPFAGKEFEGKKGTAATFKTSEPIEITDKYGSYKVSYQITDDGDGFRLQRIDEDGTKSHLGDDGFWYKTDQPMPNRRDNIVMPEKYRTEAQAHQAALEDASGMGWKGPSTATKSATQGTAAPPRVAPIAPGSAVMRPVPTLTPEEVQAWSEEADALAPGEQEIVADYLMQNPGNPEQLSPREIVARGKRDVWRMTPEEQDAWAASLLAGPGGMAQARDTRWRDGEGEVGGAPITEPPASPDTTKSTPKKPWEMTREEYKAQPRGNLSGPKNELNAVRLSDGRIFKSAKFSHDEMVEGLDADGELESTPEESRGWVVKGAPDVYIRREDLEPVFGDFQKAYVIKALSLGKPVPPAVLAEYPDLTPPVPQEPAVASETPTRTAPPRKGSTSATGWSTVAKGVARKDMQGSTVEIVRQQDGTWSVTRDEKEMDTGYKSRAEAEKYADGELAQDIRDQRNAEEEERGAGVEVEPKKAPRPQKTLLEQSIQDMEESNMPESIKQRIRENLAEREARSKKKPKGPAPADTGIYRDLTAAAREGKRFVAELHERIAPALERIYAQSKNAVDFVKQAVAKIGQHIRPYAKRFAAEVKRGVRATNAEFRQNPTRGSGPIEGKASEQAPMAKAPKGEETRASGLAQGQREGVNRQRSDTKAMFALAKEVLPPDEWKAIAKTGRKIASIKGKSEAAQRRALNRILERKMGEIEHARALKSAKASIKKARKGFKKLRPEVQAVIDEVLRGKRVKGVSQAAYDRMLQLVAEVTAGTRTGVSPATLARASKAISDFENPDLQDMKDMTAEELSGIADQIEQALQLNDSLNEGLAAERERQKALNKQAPKEVEARAPIALQNIAFENSILRSISEGTLSLSNIVRGIVGKGGHVFKTLVSDLVEADTKTLMYLRKHTEMTMARLREAGITPDKLAAMSRTLNPKAGEVEVAGVKMTKGERISLLLHLADPNTRASLLNPKSKGFEFSRAESGPNRTLKVTEEVARAIEESATPDERTVASIFWDWANGDLRDDVNEWSRRVLGYDMFTSDQHWNRRRKITDGEPAVGLLAGDFNTAQQEAGAYLKERTGGTSPIVVDDAFQHFSSHVNATSALMGKFEASVNARRLLATNEFQQAIKKNRRTGDQLFSSINKRINDWGSIAPPKSNDRLLGAVRWLGRRYSAAKLSVNLPVIISQPFSILSAAKVIPMKHITKAILGGETVHESVKREIADTPEAADLHYIINGGGHHVVTPGSITGTTAGQIFGTEKDSPLEKSMVLIQRGNNVAVSGIWRAAKAWGREQGLTGDELMKFTAKTARDAWLQTQPSNSSVYHPGLKISARTNSVAYAMTMFQGQTSIQFQDAIDAIRDYQELPAAQQTAAEKAKVLAKAARPIVLQAILFYGLKYGMEKTWEELFGRSDSKKKSDKKLDPAYDKLLDIAKSPVTSIPGIGPVVDGVIDFAKRKATGQATFGAAFDNPVVDAAGNITGFPGHLLEAAQAYKRGKEIPMSAIRGMLSAGEAVTGLPINNLRGWVEGIDRAVRDKR